MVPTITAMLASARSEHFVALAYLLLFCRTTACVGRKYAGEKSTAFLRSELMDTCWMFRSQSCSPGAYASSNVVRTHLTSFFAKPILSASA